MNQLQLFIQANTRKGMPIQCHEAAARLDLSKALRFALSVFKEHPGLTRGGTAKGRRI